MKSKPEQEKKYLPIISRPRLLKISWYFIASVGIFWAIMQTIDYIYWLLY